MQVICIYISLVIFLIFYGLIVTTEMIDSILCVPLMSVGRVLCMSPVYTLHCVCTDNRTSGCSTDTPHSVMLQYPFIHSWKISQLLMQILFNVCVNFEPCREKVATEESINQLDFPFQLEKY